MAFLSEKLTDMVVGGKQLTNQIVIKAALIILRNKITMRLTLVLR